MKRSRLVELEESTVENFENDFLYEEYLKETSINFKGFPYLCLTDVENIYTFFNGGARKGITAFLAEAREVAEKDEYYLFKNEEKLFDLLKKHFGAQLQLLRINSWGELMAYLS